MVEFIPLLMFGVICLVLLAGFPVAFSLAGTALIFAGLGVITGTFESAFLGAIPNRLYDPCRCSFICFHGCSARKIKSGARLTE